LGEVCKMLKAKNYLVFFLFLIIFPFGFLSCSSGSNVSPPSTLSYSTTSAVYTLDEVIVNNIPTVTNTVKEWSVDPALPSGLSLNTSTGVISGTPDTLQSAASYTITATNSSGSTTATISITVNLDPPTALSYSTTSAVYTLDAVISNNTPTITGTVSAWSVDPALPSGLSLDTTTGVISGTPDTEQSAANYIITAANVYGSTTATISITVNYAAPTALTYSTTSAVYNRDEVISNNTPTVTGTVSEWSVDPALPSGLSLDTTTGVISGTPDTLQSAANYTITASNSGGSTTAAISITVNLAAPTALSYSAESAVYTKDAVITNNTPTVTGTVSEWSVDPTLPTGLTLDTTTGVISGTPDTEQTAASYTITASNSTGSTTATVSITVNLEAPSNLSYSLETAVYTQYEVITNNTPTVSGTVVTWSISPELPNGLTLNTTTGVISGTPDTGQSATDYTITASNSGGSATATISIEVDLVAPDELTYSSTSTVYILDEVIENNVPSVTGTVSSWSVTPDLPSGLILDTTTGVISGTPDSLQTASDYTITATNLAGSTTASISIAVKELNLANWTERTVPGTCNPFYYSPVASSSDGTKLVVAVYGKYIFTSNDSGATWTEQKGSGKRNWRKLASSADGTKLVVSVTNGYLYTSIDSGVTWTEQTGSNQRDWRSLAISDDGTILYAAVHNGYIYKSTDSGVTWNYLDDPGSQYWSSIDCSSDGLTVVAGDSGEPGYPGCLYVSTDGGENWAYGQGTLGWNAVACSSDGTVMAACSSTDYVFTSTDSGANWTRRIAPVTDGDSITISSNGLNVAFLKNSSYIYTSADGGENWTQRTTTSSDWHSIVSSDDGTKLVASGSGLYVSTSTDSGETWTDLTHLGIRSFAATALSADGLKLAACDNGGNLSTSEGGYIYTSDDGGTTWTERQSAGKHIWTSIVSSADGTKLAACDKPPLNNYANGYIYTSDDSGATWTVRTSAGRRQWSSLASSADGTRLAAVHDSSYHGYIFTSDDSGETWTEKTNVEKSWKSIASSADGMKLAAVEDDTIWISNDRGATWTWTETHTYPYPDLKSVIMSADGTKLAVTAENRRISISDDGGLNWTLCYNGGSRIWTSLTMSNDGTKFAATANESLYTSVDSGATWIEQVMDSDIYPSTVNATPNFSKLILTSEDG